MLAEVLEGFEAGLTQAESVESNQKAARKMVGQIEALIAGADALPEDLRPTLPSEDEVARLRALTGSIVSPELQALKAKVDAAITLGEDAGLVDFDVDKARELVERYSKLATSQGGRKNGGGSKASGIRSLTHTMRVTGPDFTRLSGADTGSGDWTWVRWQITDHAKAHDGVANEALNSVRNQVQAVEAGTQERVDEVVVAGDGTEYRIEYPAL